MDVKPFFDSAGSAARRLLLISYHFPPSETAGALRWQKLAALAGDRGWSLDVITLDPEQLKQVDHSRLNELPPASRVFGVRRERAWFDRLEQSAVAWYRRLRPRNLRTATPAHGAADGSDEAGGIVQREDVRWRFASPGDYRRALHAWQYFARESIWSKAAARTALRLTAMNTYEALVTCGPPHMPHLAGSRVAARAGLPHIMDFRDPWGAATAIQTRMASPLWLTLARRYESRAVSRAALLVANTPLLAEAMAERYPGARVITVMNGYDEETLPVVAPPDRFVVAYAGSIYIDRSPRLLFRAAARVIRELGLPPSRFQLAFIGHLDDEGGASILRQARAEGLEDGYVDVGPPRPRRAALEFLAGASVLVSLPQQVRLAVPSKIFEYMRFNAWVLALAASGTATERVLRGTRADVVDPQDIDGLAAVLRKRYQQYCRGERPAPVPADERLARRTQAAVLLDALEGPLGSR